MSPREGPPPRSATRARRSSSLLAVGRIVRPHGLRGQVIVESPIDLVRRLKVGTKLKSGRKGAAWEVREVRAHQGRFALTIAGCEDREAAEVLRGTVLYAREAELEPLAPGERYTAEVIGLSVATESGEAIGRIERVQPSPAHDLFEVRQADGRSFLVPATEPFIRSIDTSTGVVTVRLIPGMRPEG